MAGLLAWAADVVGGGANDGDELGMPRVTFTTEQQMYVNSLEDTAGSLQRTIDQLKARLPPEHISQRLPHLHAHSLASNAALAIQLDDHSATRHETQVREATLQEENTAYEKAISIGQKQIQEKMQEASMLENKVKEMELSERALRDELEKMQTTWETGRTRDMAKSGRGSIAMEGSTPSVALISDELEKKKRELNSLEERVLTLENTWAAVERESLRQPSPAQREKILEKQLHSLLEQLSTKQAQAEELAGEIRAKRNELEKLNGVQPIVSLETNAARNRSGRSESVSSSGLSIPLQDKPNMSGKNSRIRGNLLPSGNLKKVMLARSAFALYILILHLVVFIKISFAKLGRRS